MNPTTNPIAVRVIKSTKKARVDNLIIEDYEYHIENGLLYFSGEAIQEEAKENSPAIKKHVLLILSTFFLMETDD